MRETVWCAPRDREDELKDVVADLDLGRLVHVFVGRPATFMDVDELMHEWWDMDSLSDRYASFTATFGHLRTGRARQGLSDEEALLWWLRVTHDYQSLVHRDPDLPAELLPPAARRLRAGAVKLFATLEGGLGDRARGHVLRRLGVGDVATPAQRR